MKFPCLSLGRYLVVLIGYFAFAVVLPGCVSLHENGIKQLREELPYRSILTYTGSMEPAYHGGEAVIVIRMDYRLLKVGNDVVYWPENSEFPVLHRIVGRQGGLFLMRGINNFWDDNLMMNPDNYIGVAGHETTP